MRSAIAHNIPAGICDIAIGMEPSVDIKQFPCCSGIKQSTLSINITSHKHNNVASFLLPSFVVSSPPNRNCDTKVETGEQFFEDTTHLCVTMYAERTSIEIYNNSPFVTSTVAVTPLIGFSTVTVRELCHARHKSTVPHFGHRRKQPCGMAIRY